MRGAAQQGGVVICADANEYAGLAADERTRRYRCIFERLPGQLQKQSLLWIDPDCLARRDPEKQRLKLIDFGDETTLANVCLAGPPRGRIVERVDIPTVRRNVAAAISARAQCLP